jgi:hypothetical protein
MSIGTRAVRLALFITIWSAIASAQTVTVVRNVNLRPEQTSSEPAIRLLTPSEPPLELLEPLVMDGYFHVKTSAGEEGYVWSRSVQVTVAPPAALGAAAGIQPGPGVPGSPSIKGCGDGRWKHVYHPTRLIVKNRLRDGDGVIMDATASQSHHQKDGMRHEGDGDTHGWMKVDPQFASLINDGNTSDEEGNLVFEITCHYPVKQADAKSTCAGFTDHTVLPKIGARVAIRGTFVTEKNHQKWNEIHPVSSIKVQ